MSECLNHAALRKLAGELAKEFEELARELDELAQNVNIARVVGGAVGAVGSVISAAGFIAIPFTAGVSALVAGIGGGIAGAAGGLTAGGAKITQMFIEKSKMKDAATKWETFCKGLAEEMEKNPELRDCVKNTLEANLSRLGLGSTEIAKDIGVWVVRASKATTSLGAQAGSRVAVAVASGSVVLNVFTIGLSLYDIIDGSMELADKKKSKPGEILAKIAESLKKFAETGKWL